MSTRDEWIEAAAVAMSGGGVDAIRVEALARQLGITKGSFYWHFTDRNALLDAVLAQWEAGARRQLEAARSGNTAEERMASFFRDLARPANGVADMDILAWARHDRLVAERVSAVERDRLVFVKEQLSGMGASLVDAHRRAEAGYLAVQAWLERAARTPWMKGDYVAFVNGVFRLLLRSSTTSPS